MTNSLLTKSGSGIDDAAVKEFTDRISGQIIEPGDADYDDARHVFNGMIDRRPGLIVRPANVQDVVDAVTGGGRHRRRVSGCFFPGYRVLGRYVVVSHHVHAQ